MSHEVVSSAITAADQLRAKKMLAKFSRLEDDLLALYSPQHDPDTWGKAIEYVKIARMLAEKAMAEYYGDPDENPKAQS